jgi:hypothetical protein
LTSALLVLQLLFTPLVSSNFSFPTEQQYKHKDKHSTTEQQYKHKDKHSTTEHNQLNYIEMYGNQVHNGKMENISNSRHKLLFLLTSALLVLQLLFTPLVSSNFSFPCEIETLFSSV